MFFKGLISTSLEITLKQTANPLLLLCLNNRMVKFTVVKKSVRRT